MATTQKYPNGSALPPNPARTNRFQAFLERAVRHLPRKPNHVNKVKQGATIPLHERQLAENMRLIRHGYQPEEIIAALETIIMEIEDATNVTDFAGENTRPAVQSIAAIYQDALDAEGAAAPLQNKATVTGDAADLDRALDALAVEIAKEKKHWRAMKRRRDTLHSLRTHVGYVSRSSTIATSGVTGGIPSGAR